MNERSINLYIQPRVKANNRRIYNYFIRFFGGYTLNESKKQSARTFFTTSH